MKTTKKLLVPFFVVTGFCGVFLSFAWLALAGSYLDSRHGTAVNRSSIDNKFSTYATGNCGHCHEQHASLNGGEPVPDGNAPSGYLTFATEQALCLTCHDGAPATTNIQASFNKLYKHGKNGSTGTDYMITYDDRHRAGEKTSAAFDSFNRHAECVDCHNPHQATDANPLKGATGITPTNGGAWTSPSSPATSAEVNDPAQQYKICFKCHSNWAGFGTGTNQALEFNTVNPSYHNIEGAANPPSSDTYGNFNPTYVYKMMPRYSGWGTSTVNTSTMNVNLRNAAMRCSDCHGDTDASPQGIHGSATRPILKVPAGSPFTAWNNTLNLASLTTIWCFNCHASNFANTGFGNSTSNWHTTKHNKSNAYCQTCHSAIPHGWKRSRMLIYTWGTTIDPAPYNNRYGSVTGLSSAITWKASGSWTQNDCHNGGVGSCG